MKVPDVREMIGTARALTGAGLPLRAVVLVLLIGHTVFTPAAVRVVRAFVLRARPVEVHEAGDLYRAPTAKRCTCIWALGWLC